MFNCFVQLFGYISLTFITIIVFTRILIFSYETLFSSKSIDLRGGPDAWAVVTGATDGIGLEYAKQLAEKRYNLLLLSRSLDKLNCVKAMIETKNGCQVRVIAVDFRFTDIYDKIEEQLKILKNIDILVNNVGIAHPNARPRYFTDLPNDYVNDLINVNVLACTKMIKLVLPRMEKTGKGLIINISSGAGLYPVPFSSAYSASKAYIDFLSRALNEEYKSKGIAIQSVLPFFVSTKVIESIEHDQFTVSPENFVSTALTTVGESERTSGHRLHKIQYFMVELFNVLSKLIGFDINILIAIAVQKKLMDGRSHTKTFKD